MYGAALGAGAAGVERPCTGSIPVGGLIYRTPLVQPRMLISLCLQSA